MTTPQSPCNKCHRYTKTVCDQRDMMCADWIKWFYKAWKRTVKRFRPPPGR